MSEKTVADIRYMFAVLGEHLAECRDPFCHLRLTMKEVFSKKD